MKKCDDCKNISECVDVFNTKAYKALGQYLFDIVPELPKDKTIADFCAGYEEQREPNFKYLIVCIYDSACEYDVLSNEGKWGTKETLLLINTIYGGWGIYNFPQELLNKYDLVVVAEGGQITVIKG